MQYSGNTICVTAWCCNNKLNKKLGSVKKVLPSKVESMLQLNMTGIDIKLWPSGYSFPHAIAM